MAGRVEHRLGSRRGIVNGLFKVEGIDGVLSLDCEASITGSRALLWGDTRENTLSLRDLILGLQAWGGRLHGLFSGRKMDREDSSLRYTRLNLFRSLKVVPLRLMSVKE